MTIKVTLKNCEVKPFGTGDSEYWERGNGFFEIHQGDEMVKIFAKGYWVAVEGKRKPDPLDSFGRGLGE